MRTVKDVSDLTGISVRALHYYDEIGLLKPTEITDAGYRLYDDEALKELQQIMFFRELDLPLKEVKAMMSSPHFDKKKTLESHQKLLILKRDRLNDLIELVNQTLKGENSMSFKEFDMSEYFKALEQFKLEHEGEVIQYYGGVETFDEILNEQKSNQASIAQMAIKEFGSIEQYTEAMKKNISNLPSIMEKSEKFKQEVLEERLRENNELHQKLAADLSKDPTSQEIQHIVEEIMNLSKENYKFLGMKMGDNHSGLMAELFLTNPTYMEVTDKKYGPGASRFIGEALSYYSRN